MSKQKIYIGKTKEQFIDWLKNKYHYTPVPEPKPIDQFNFLYKLEGETEWQEYVPTENDIRQDDDGQATLVVEDFRLQDWFEDVREVKLPNKWNSNGTIIDVTSIGNGAFSDCTNLTSITIPDSIIRIGEGAFNYCLWLTDVTIPDNVTSIGKRAFNDCDNFTTVTIPNSVTSIGDYAFSGCNGLTQFIVDDDNPNYKAVNGLLLSRDGKTLVSVPGSLVSVTIPDSVTSIGDTAFVSCEQLTSVTIPDSVMNIGAHAFQSCIHLTSVTIPDSVTSIGGSAFAYCHDLTSMTIPDSVTSIGSWVFDNCSKMTSITIGNGVPSIGERTFQSCYKLRSVTIGNSVMSIEDFVFWSCNKLTSIEFEGNAPSTVGANAFVGVASGCKAIISSIATGFNVDSQGKWNGLIVEVKQ